MIFVSVDSSSTTGACAVVDKGEVIAEGFIKGGRTHSQTLLPLIKNTLELAKVSPEEVDGYAVTVGPGSFTGLRIGIATVKGMAAAYRKPVMPVSPLHALAIGVPDFNGIICAVMDARNNQVYYALFDIMYRLCPDSAASIDEVLKKLKELNQKVIIVGDAAEKCYEMWKNEIDCLLAHPSYREIRGGNVAKAAMTMVKKAKYPEDIQPVYLKLPQAERELKAKRSKLKC